ncbi:nickel-responsive transcriptional regulator NikR, partial [bacterium]
MSDLVRLSLSIERPLYEQLERLAAHGEFANRSEFVRGMIRDRLVHEAWQGDGEALATITLVYDHHQRQLTEKLVELQHTHHSAVLAATHVHLDEHLCAEMIMVRGAPGEIRHLADHMRRWLKIPLFLPTALLILIYLISTIFSLSPLVSLWGSYQRMQGTYSMLSYIVVFALIAGNLRTREQVERLV